VLSWGTRASLSQAST
jgi:hypothetical protein